MKNSSPEKKILSFSQDLKPGAICLLYDKSKYYSHNWMHGTWPFSGFRNLKIKIYTPMQ